MRKFYSLLTITAILVVSNCSKIPENNDPILGAWENRTVISKANQTTLKVREEWIFNDVFLGRYHKFENGELTLLTDFGWKKDDGEYIIFYPGLDRAEAEVHLEYTEEDEILEMDNGKVFARRR